MVPLLFQDVAEIIALVIEIFAIFFIIHGAFYAIYRLARIEVLHEKRFHKYEHTKRILIQKIIFALDFFVAADLIKLVIISSFSDVLQIALIVAIRTVLSWSLSREIHLHKEGNV